MTTPKPISNDDPLKTYILEAHEKTHKLVKHFKKTSIQDHESFIDFSSFLKLLKIIADATFYVNANLVCLSSLMNDYKKELIKDHPYLVENYIDLLEIGDVENSLKELHKCFFTFYKGINTMDGSNLPVIKNILKNKIHYYGDNEDNEDLVYLENCNV